MPTEHTDINIAIRDLTTELLAAMKSANVKDDREGIAIEQAFAKLAEEILKRSIGPSIDSKQPIAFGQSSGGPGS